MCMWDMAKYTIMWCKITIISLFLQYTVLKEYMFDMHMNPNSSTTIVH